MTDSMPRIKKRLPAILATLIGSALSGQSALAVDLKSQCMLGIPVYKRPFYKGDNRRLPVTIYADRAEGQYSDYAVFNGNVDILQGNSRLQADEVQLHQQQKAGESAPGRTVDAKGNVRYDDDRVILRGPKAWSNLNTKDIDVWNGDYQMVGRQGRGSGEQMELREDGRYTILQNGSYTSCLPGDNSWSVVGTKVIHDRDKQVAEIWNARFKIGSVPIFYSPYLQLPVGDRRRSGFLIPNMKFSNVSGFELMLPWYWNIAPQVDATITPHYIEKRGQQIQNEFRYLTVFGTGVMDFDYMGSDKVYRDRIRSGVYQGDADKNKRWAWFWQHNGIYNQHWRLGVNYTRVSDPNYFTDLNSAYGSSTDGYASQIFSLGYADTNWDATLSSKQFQIFQQTINERTNVYRAEPQLDFNYYHNDIGPFDSQIYAQIVKFTNVNSRYPTATRLHFEPMINLPLSNGWASLNTEAKLMVTHYQQGDIDWYNRQPQRVDNHLDSTVNRVLPEFKTNGKLVFTRDMNWSPGYTQTLEPRVQYLYIPYRDQSNIMAYDSTLLQYDYNGLFRDRAYGGLDRINSANQITTGITTRVFDDELVERFNASIGQIYAFSHPHNGISKSYYNQNDTAVSDNTRLLDDGDKGSVIWAGDTYWRINDSWSARGGIEYDSRLDDITQGNAVLEYRRDTDRMVQLNYRFTSPKYIKATLPNIRWPGYQQGISQMGATMSWPISDAWSVVGAWYFDTKARQTADQLLGMQYSSCCYAVRFGYERKITNWDYTRNESKYDNAIWFNIELRGLSANYGLGTNRMLREGILPYQRSF